MNAKETALALALMTVVADAAKEQKDALRDGLMQTLNDLGGDSVRAELNGERVARCSIVSRTRKAVVADEQALVAWVADNHETEVVRAIRDSFKSYLLGQVIEGPDGVAIFKETGEIVPGVSFASSASFISTRFEKGGREAIINAVREGQLAISLTAPAGELEA